MDLASADCIPTPVYSRQAVNGNLADKTFRSELIVLTIVLSGDDEYPDCYLEDSSELGTHSPAV